MPSMVAASEGNECASGSKEAATGRPFCFDCGYDLHGLELPRACPECGCVADLAGDVRRVRSWFACRSAAIGWILYPSKIPAGAWYALSDSASLQLARKREWLWLWLPAILAAVTVAAGCLITVEYDAKVWYYKQADPDRKPLRVVNESETDRLYAFNLQLFRGGFFFTKPASWVQVVERQRKRLGISLPDYLEPTFLFWGCAALFAVIFGYLPARGVVLGHAKYAAKSRGQPGLQRASRAVWTLMAVSLGIVLWLWLGAVVLYGFSKLLIPTANEFYLVAVLLCVPAGLWVLVSLIGYARLMKQDRARFIVANRLVGCTVLTAVSIGGPAAVFWALIEAFY